MWIDALHRQHDPDDVEERPDRVGIGIPSLLDKNGLADVADGGNRIERESRARHGRSLLP